MHVIQSAMVCLAMLVTTAHKTPIVFNTHILLGVSALSAEVYICTKQQHSCTFIEMLKMVVQFYKML